MKNKVLIVGIDSLDSKIINKLKGRLPNLKSLETYSQLQTTIPPETPVAWSAAATGSNPGRYGIFDFINRDLQTYTPKLGLIDEKKGIIKTGYQSAMKGIPFWRILNQNNIKSTIIRWPVTFPPEKINGRMLSGLGVVDIKNMLGSYALYTEKYEKEDTEKKGEVIKVDVNDNIINTYISGPLVQKRGELQDIKTPMKIAINDQKTIITINDDEYEVKVNEWSEMIRVKFKVYSFVEIYGIFKLYIESIKPEFEMYVGAIQIDPENQIVNITYPKEYGKELVENIGLFYTLGMPEDVNAVKENNLTESALIQQIKEIEEQRNKMFFYEFKRFKEGIFVCVFDAGDRLKHIFWKNKVLDGNREFIVPKEIEDYYIEKDKFIGVVISKIDNDTKLIIFSDHGFNSFERQVNINSWLVEQGYMKINESADNSLLQFVDWSNTKAYSLGFTSLYINQKGREGKGIVGKEEKSGIINEIINSLKNLKDDSRPVFTHIYRGEDIYKGEHSHLAPDIVLGFSEGYRMSDKNAIGSLDTSIILDNLTKWRGDHLIDRSHVPGVLFTNFKINKENPDITDIAPTVFKLFNVKIPQTIDGCSLI